jgi:hypothetical protein
MFILFVIIALFILFFPPDQLIYFFAGSIDVKDAMESIYLLMQIESTVFAIIISLSLVAVQLASTSFTTRVIEIFRKDKIFWSIVIFYVLLTIYGIIILTLYHLQRLWGLQNWIFFYFILGIIAFLSVIPFIYNTLNILKPITLIKKLSSDITRKKIILNIEDEENHEDPIQPIIDILQSSLMKHDYRTLKECLVEIKDSISDILISDEISEEDRKINNYLLNHFKRISNLAISQKDEEALKEIIDTLAMSNGVLGEGWKYDKVIFEETADFIDEIEKLVLDQEMENSLIYIPNFLCKIGEIAVANNNKKRVDLIMGSLQSNIRATMDKNMDLAAVKTASSLVKVGNFTLDNYVDAIEAIIILRYLFDSITIAIEDLNDVLASSLFEELCKAARYGIESRSAAIMGFTPYYIKELRNNALQYNLLVTPSYAGECIVNVFNSYMDFTELDPSIEHAFGFIKHIGENAEGESDNTKEMLIKSLKKIIGNMRIHAEVGIETEFYNQSIEELNSIVVNLENSLTDLSPLRPS